MGWFLFNTDISMHDADRQLHASREWRHGSALVAEVPSLWEDVARRHEWINPREHLHLLVEEVVTPILLGARAVVTGLIVVQHCVLERLGCNLSNKSI